MKYDALQYRVRQALALIAYFSLLFFSITAHAEDMLHAVDTQTRITMDGNAVITEYANDLSTAGGDGALLEIGPDVLLGTSEGEFFLIKDNLSIQHASIPQLDVGATAFEKQTRYNYSEKPPRLHGLAQHKNKLYAAVDRYDAQENLMYFAIYAIELDGKEWQRIYQSPALDTPYYSMGGGGRMTVIGDTLYFSVGDYSFDRTNNLPSDYAAQNPALPFGKVMKLDLPSGLPTPYVSGVRNVLGMTNDNGKLVITDNGPRGGDSVYIARQDANYGWPYSSLGRKYFNFGPYTNPNPPAPPPPDTRPEWIQKIVGWLQNKKLIKDDRPKVPTEPDSKFPYELPDFTFVPSVAPTQIIKLDNFSKDWDGDFLVGSLKGRQISRLHRENGSFAYGEAIFIGQRIRDMVQHHNQIWILTDAGSIMTLSLNAPDALFPKVSGAIQKCMICHVIDQDHQAPTPFAPNLYGVVGRHAGSSGFTGYSSAMKKAGAETVWNHDTLFAFLRAPQVLIPGTAMPNLAYSSSNDEIEAIIKALTALTSAQNPKPNH